MTRIRFVCHRRSIWTVGWSGRCRPSPSPSGHSLSVMTRRRIRRRGIEQGTPASAGVPYFLKKLNLATFWAKTKLHFWISKSVRGSPSQKHRSGESWSKRPAITLFTCQRLQKCKIQKVMKASDCKGYRWKAQKPLHFPKKSVSRQSLLPQGFDWTFYSFTLFILKSENIYKFNTYLCIAVYIEESFRKKCKTVKLKFPNFFVDFRPLSVLDLEGTSLPRTQPQEKGRWQYCSCGGPPPEVHWFAIPKIKMRNAFCISPNRRGRGP